MGCTEISLAKHRQNPRTQHDSEAVAVEGPPMLRLSWLENFSFRVFVRGSSLIPGETMIARLALVLCLLVPTFAWADDNSGNSFERGCRMAIAREEASDLYEAARVGECLGAMRTISILNNYLDPRLKYCPPKGATTGQLIKIVLKYMDDHPEQMNKDFVHLSLIAINSVWACTRNSSMEK